MLYAITNRRLYGTDAAAAHARMLEQIAVWVTNSVAFIQLREKDLRGREQVELARSIQAAIQKASSRTRLLINGRPDVALAAGADGVHLPSDLGALTPEEVRKIFAASRPKTFPTISISCHTLQEVESARNQKVDCILFAPIFEKRIGNAIEETVPGTGLALLADACRAAGSIPVFALGGVTTENAPQCISAGAAGVAAIRLMLEPPSVWRNLA